MHILKKAVLLILDGWGYGKEDETNAIYHANVPYFRELLKTYPNSKLQASGEDVGLPAGQMGNSEVGHMNLGAGRVVYQELTRINIDVREHIIDTNPELIKAIEYAKELKKAVHFMGLLSDGGVHSHILHLEALLEITASAGLKELFVHAFLDGRDTDPKGGAGYISQLTPILKKTGATLSSLIGRYYAMDRDNRWERVRKAYDLLINGIGKHTRNMMQSVLESYNENITDEFIMPLILVDEHDKPFKTIQADEVVIFFNFRTDRGRELSLVLTQRAIPEQEMTPLSLYFVTMVSYDQSFTNVRILYQKDDLIQTMGEVLEAAGKNQIRIAETEKYPHVTFFFSGGREKEFMAEKRLLIPSAKVATYDLQPEMSALEITAAILPELKKEWADFICLNFANPDMVGHTGVFEAVIKAVETVDTCLKQVVETGLEHGYSFIILADHGNSEFMKNADMSPNTAHTSNLVPCILIDEQFKHIDSGKLGDVAPSILTLMGIPVPSEMTGNILVSV